jgi:hypothetical protein
MSANIISAFFARRTAATPIIPQTALAVKLAVAEKHMGHPSALH